MTAAFYRTWMWTLGPLPERRDPEANSLGLLVWVVLVAATAMFVGDQFGLGRGADPLMRGAWRQVVHWGIPLAGVAVWELGIRGHQKALAAIIASLCAGAISLRWFDRDLLREEVWLSAGPAFAIFALTAWGLRREGVSLDRWSLGLGKLRWWLPRTLAIITVMVPLLVVSVFLFPSLADFYPTHRPARSDPMVFARLHLGILLDFIGWEYLFRGFLLDGAWRRGDAAMAIAVQTLPYFLLHYNKPPVEMLSSLIGGALAGWFCLKARSSLPMVVIHLTMITTVGLAAQLVRALS